MLTAHKMLPIRKTEFARRMIGLRPKISLSFPHRGILAAFASKYADPVHAYKESGIWKSRDIDGRAVGIKTVSKAARKMLRVRAKKQRSVGNEGRPLVGVASLLVDVVDILAGRCELRCRSSVFACSKGKVAEELSVFELVRWWDAVSSPDVFAGNSGKCEHESCFWRAPKVLSFPTINGVCDVAVVVAEAMMPTVPKRATTAGKSSLMCTSNVKKQNRRTWPVYPL